MSLAPGTRLGPYQIVAPIGAGGMGELYRATDSQLKRSVAIKVLPAAPKETGGESGNLAQNISAVISTARTDRLSPSTPAHANPSQFLAVLGSTSTSGSRR